MELEQRTERAVSDDVGFRVWLFLVLIAVVVDIDSKRRKSSCGRLATLRSRCQGCEHAHATSNSQGRSSPRRLSRSARAKGRVPLTLACHESERR
jgi:hypothetical protein